MKLPTGLITVVVSLCIGVALVSAAAYGKDTDWPQWRGPHRNSIATQSPPLLEEFPKDGLKKVWESEEIPRGNDENNSSGFGSPVVVGGKVYFYLCLLRNAKVRVLEQYVLEQEGYNPKVPAELAKSVEEARMSDSRRDPANVGNQVYTWANKWIEANLKDEQRPYVNWVRRRLVGGPEAVSLEALPKLTEIVGKKFSTEELLEWLGKNGIDEASRKQILCVIPEMKKLVDDYVYCLDAQTGKTIWKTPPVEGVDVGHPNSTTPAIVGKKCYLFGSSARVFCFDAETGTEIWHSEAVGHESNTNRSSSVFLTDGVAIASREDCLAGVDAQTGKTLWSRKDLRNGCQQASAANWNDGQRNLFLLNMGHYTIGNKLFCIDPKDGSTKWETVTKGSQGNPSVLGDYAVMADCGDDHKGKGGIAAYKMSPDKAQRLWEVPFSDGHTGPLIDKGYVYVVGGGYEDIARACCINLESGKLQWEEPLGKRMAQCSSPVLADGKIIAVDGPELLVFKADPAKFTLIGKANLGLLKWPSPALSDGKVFLRTATKIACYDLRRP